MKYVNQPVQKTDAMALVTGKPVYTDDLAPKRFPDRQSPAKPSCQCMGRHDQDGYSKESSWHRLCFYL